MSRGRAWRRAQARRRKAEVKRWMTFHQDRHQGWMYWNINPRTVGMRARTPKVCTCCNEHRRPDVYDDWRKDQE